ncbi:hypothetical protein BD414DRAFT_495210, partial [Trametes punicea]
MGMLREQTSRPAIGIFEASITQALALGQPFGIVTTGHYWEQAFAAGVKRLFGSTDIGGTFVGVERTGTTAAELHERPHSVVAEKIATATTRLVSNGARTTIMGCAGMSGMEEAVSRGSKGVDIRIIDASRSGLTTLEGLSEHSHAS